MLRRQQQRFDVLLSPTWPLRRCAPCLMHITAPGCAGAHPMLPARRCLAGNAGIPLLSLHGASWPVRTPSGTHPGTRTFFCATIVDKQMSPARVLCIQRKEACPGMGHAPQVGCACLPAPAEPLRLCKRAARPGLVGCTEVHSHMHVVFGSSIVHALRMHHTAAARSAWMTALEAMPRSCDA